MPDTTAIVAIVIGLAVVFVIGAALHVWYAAGLSRVFAAHDTATWRAWVPLVNEAELFRLGRVDPVKAALFVVPVVAIYALVLKGVSAHRIGLGYRLGAGATALAVLLPPVWATILSTRQPVLSVDVDGDDVEEPIVELVPAGQPVGVTPPAPAQGPITAAPVAAAPVIAAVPAASVAPAAAPAAITPPAPAASVAPVAPVAPAAPAAVPVAPVAPAAAPVAPAAPAAAPVAPAAPAPAAAPLRRRSTPVPAASGWAVILPTGESVALTAPAVVLGRRPDEGVAGQQGIAVADDTRTVSKQHARLTYTDSGWVITDLGSMNGVRLVTSDGATHTVSAPVPVTPVFFLGDARLELRYA